jgi:hypothetical protein
MYGKGRDGLRLYHYSGRGDYLCSAREVDMFMTSSFKWVPMSPKRERERVRERAMP